MTTEHLTITDQVDTAALIARAHAAGLETLPSETGLMLWWPHEDPGQLLPLTWEDVPAWLDQFADDPPVQDRPPAPGVLSDSLQAIAQRYVAARQRSGEALLEAAAALAEARQQAKYGQWGTFLEATGTSDDAAERLLSIHAMAHDDPAFADSIRRGWLNQTTAALLARSSTPDEIVTEMLNAPKPPSKREVERAISNSKIHPGADFAEPPALKPSADAPRWASVPDLPPVSWNTTPAEPPALPAVDAADADPTSDDWYTPAWLIDAARAVLGGIDLDPASCDEAQAAICATTYYTVATNGLAHPWHGRIWLNPPYSEPFPWVQRLSDGVAAGTSDAGILLANTANSPQWAQCLWRADYPVCLLNKRVGFWRPSGATKGGDRDQMIVLVCRPDDLPRRRAFRCVFGDYGAIR